MADLTGFQSIYPVSMYLLFILSAADYLLAFQVQTRSIITGAYSE